MSRRLGAVLATALATTLATIVLTGVSTFPAHAARVDGEQPPQPHDDTATWYAGGTGSPDVLANDTDPQGETLRVCRVDSHGITDYLGWSASVSPRGKLYVSTDRSTRHFTFTYDACNDTRLAPARVHVTLTKAAKLTVRALPHRPSKVEVTNPDPVSALFVEGDFDHGDLHFVPVAADSTRLVRVHHRYIDWQGFVGTEHGYAGHGLVRDVPLWASDARTDHSDAQNSTSIIIGFEKLQEMRAQARRD